jgi:hypothetical protein
MNRGRCFAAEQEYNSVHLVQLLIPLQDDDGQPYPRRHYDGLARRLTEQFGGVTAYARAPATGLWEAPSGQKVRDEIVVYEVMVETLDAAWWAATRQGLEALFGQRELVIRALAIERL